MSETEDLKNGDSASRAITRRRFILGVIAGGAVVGAASYRFLAPSSHGRASSGERLITINVNGKPRRVDVMRQETLAWTLRMRSVHGYDRRRAALQLFSADAHRARPQGGHDRGIGRG